MPRRVLALALIMFGLTLVSSAQAKDAITRLRICGASRCTTIANVKVLEIVMTDIGDESATPAARVPFYTMRPEKTPEWPTTWPHYLYVPSSNAVWVMMGNGERYWDRLSFDLAAPLLGKAAQHLKANPAPQTWRAVATSFRPEGADRSWPWKWFATGALASIVLWLVARRARYWKRHGSVAPGQRLGRRERLG
jgi:hypothetical protein